jgi:ABC-type bacteriocin/lantibiotic exporter with double-glycine peptidase domain
MYSRTTIVYFFLILSIFTLLLSHTIQTTYGDIVPKSNFEMVNWIAFFIIIITILPLTRTYILRA